MRFSFDPSKLLGIRVILVFVLMLFLLSGVYAISVSWQGEADQIDMALMYASLGILAASIAQLVVYIDSLDE